MNYNVGPKLGQNSRPRLGENSGPRMSENSTSRLQLNAGAGAGKKGTQKLSIPCNFYRNTENVENHQNVEEALNKEFILNIEQTITFKSTDDILDLLKTHPDFERIPPDCLQPIIAGLLAGLIGAIGTIVLIIAPTSTALVIKIIAGAASSGGFSGVENALKHGIRGTFSWTNWTADIGLSAAASLITLGLSTLAAWKTTTSVMLNTREISVEFLESVVRSAKITSTLIGSVTSTATESIKKLIKNENIDPTMLFIAFLTGGLQGYKAGSTVSEKAILNRLQNLSKSPEKLCEFYKNFWTSQKNFWGHVDKHAKEINPDSFDIDGVQFNLNDAKSSIVLSDHVLDKLDGTKNMILARNYGAAAANTIETQDVNLLALQFDKDSWIKVYFDQNKRMLCLTRINDQLITAHKVSSDPAKALKKFYEVKRFYTLDNKDDILANLNYISKL